MWGRLLVVTDLEVLNVTLVYRIMTVSISNWRMLTDILMSDHPMVRYEITSEPTLEILHRNP